MIITSPIPPQNHDVIYPLDYSPERSVIAKLKRRATHWRKAKPLGTLGGSAITFSFDDFPKSAADTGAEIMEMISAPAIYYACSGLVGRTNQTGEQYTQSDLAPLIAAGHEIGAHTHSHLDCADVTTRYALDDIELNLKQLRKMGVTRPITHFAYPYGETTIELKRALVSRFDTCRGILPGQNTAHADAMQLSAMELTPDESTAERALCAIETARHKPSWLHIFTHDVRKNPSPFGVTPATLKTIAKAARASGLPIITGKNFMAKLKENEA